MAKIKEYYYDEVTSKSFEELLNLARWMNSQHSHYPLIVGGWAVWCYTKGLGSRDVDVVFPSRESKHRVIVDFLMSHGYEKVGNILEKRFIKRLMTGNREEEIIIDACSYEDEVAVTGTGIRIPWKYAGKHSRKYEIEKGVFIRIPEVETLLTYKIAAVLGRSNQLRTTLEPEYVQAKVWKDIYDVVSLMKKCDL